MLQTTMPRTMMLQNQVKSWQFFSIMAMMAMIIAWGPQTAMAVKISDITHLQGSRINKLTGVGLVVGLKGTGDGAKYTVPLRALAQKYKNFGLSVSSLDELKTSKNIAIVEIEATLPEYGVREGDRVDVRVVSSGAAKSLVGGQLIMTPLVSGNPTDTRVMALASGPLQIPDATVPTVGRISKGATLEQDFIHNYVVLGRELSAYTARSVSRPLEWLNPDERYVTFVINEAHSQWSIAHTIAQHINENEAQIGTIGNESSDNQLAVAFDPRTVIVRLPKSEWDDPSPFLYRIEKIQLLMPAMEARVVIDRTAGSIIFSDDTEISPVAITHKSLTISTTTTVSNGSEQQPDEGVRSSTGYFASVDPQHRGGAKLKDLIDALNQLKVPFDDRAAIIESLYRGGQLHANLIVE